MNRIEHAASLLKQGKLVAIPTETVYGLAADANNLPAIEKVYQTKGRPTHNPLIIHLPNIDAIEHWAIDIPETAYRLANAFWPGPLTLLLKRHPRVLKRITANQETVALRIPNHPLTLELLTQFNGGVVAPSANRYGHVSPTTAKHVEEELGTSVNYILDGGACSVGIESSILSLVDKPTLLRRGSLTINALSAVLKQEILTTNTTAIQVPGLDVSHYAPSKPLYLVDENKLTPTILALNRKNLSVDVISFYEKPRSELPNAEWTIMANDPIPYAQQLYDTLHRLDKTPRSCIVVSCPPRSEEWLAILDRLERASRSLP